MDSSSAAAHYLALLAQPKIGPAAIKVMTLLGGGLEVLLSGNAVLRPFPSSDGEEERPPPPQYVKLLPGLPAAVAKALPTAIAEVAAARSAGLEVLTVDDPGYPPALLHELSDPPPVLFIEGTLPAALSATYESLPACAVVGTRRAARFSLTFARDLGRELAGLGFVVVSGLALGIDAAAHAGVLEAVANERNASTAASGATVAVLGGGHRRFHPAANRALAAAITAGHGAVISEWPPDRVPAPHQFLQRNRVISGLARAVIVVEAGQRSGALNTAAHALRQGRNVLVVPGRPGAAMAGNLDLLREGVAAMLVGLADLYMSFHNVPGVGRRLERHFVKASGAKLPAEPESSGSGANSSAMPPTLGALIHEHLRQAGDATADQLLESIGARSPVQKGVTSMPGLAVSKAPTVAMISAALLELELRGDVVSSAGGRFQLSASTVR